MKKRTPTRTHGTGRWRLLALISQYFDGHVSDSSDSSLYMYLNWTMRMCGVLHALCRLVCVLCNLSHVCP